MSKSGGGRRVVHMAPPQLQKSRRRGNQRPSGILWLRSHRAEVAPWFVAWAVGLVTTAAHSVPLAPLWFVLGAGLGAGALHQWGDRVRSVRQFTARRRNGRRSRLQWARFAYIMAMPFVAAGWAIWATWPDEDGTTAPGPWEWLVLIVVTASAASGWWVTLRRNKSVRIEMVGMSSKAQYQALKDARTLILDWVGFTSAAGLQGAELRGIVFSNVSVRIRMRIRRGQTTRNFTELRREKLATASLWTISENMVRVDRNIDGDSRMIEVRYMIGDPLAEELKPPAFEYMDAEKIIIGMFEDGVDVTFEWINTLIAGLTRAGKSGVLNTLIRAFAKIEWVAIIGVDVKPGAPELSPWRDVMAALGDSPGATRDLLERIMEGLTRRGELMSERGWRVWQPSRDEPFLVVIIDEIQLLDKRCRDLVAEIASVIAAFGGIIIVATQYPVKENLPSKIKQNLDQRIGLRTADGTADQVIFGSSAKQTGWTPSILCRSDLKGTFLIRNGIHQRPMLARGFWQDDEENAADVTVLRHARTMVDAATWVPMTHREAAELEAGDTVVAVQVFETNEDKVLSAIDLGHVKPEPIAEFTGIAKRTVNEILRKLASEGIVTQDGKARGPYRRA